MLPEGFCRGNTLSGAFAAQMHACEDCTQGVRIELQQRPGNVTVSGIEYFAELLCGVGAALFCVVDFCVALRGWSGTMAQEAVTCVCCLVPLLLLSCSSRCDGFQINSIGLYTSRPICNCIESTDSE